MKTKNENHQFDFVSTYEPKDTLGKFLKKGMYSLHYKINYSRLRNWSLKAIAIGSVAIVISSVFGYLSTVEKENNKIKILQIAQKEKDEKLNLQKEQILEEQDIKKVKKITPEDINDIVDFIKLVQINQNKRIEDFYWKLSYISSKNPKYYPMPKYVREISNLRKDMNDYYELRIIGIPRAYQAIKDGESKLQEGLSAQKIVFWHNAMKSKEIPQYEYLDNYLVNWNEDFTDHKAIQKYLEDNKDLISKTKPFI